jgi:hypothetical protein
MIMKEEGRRKKEGLIIVAEIFVKDVWLIPRSKLSFDCPGC